MFWLHAFSTSAFSLRLPGGAPHGGLQDGGFVCGSAGQRGGGNGLAWTTRVVKSAWFGLIIIGVIL